MSIILWYYLCLSLWIAEFVHGEEEQKHDWNSDTSRSAVFKRNKDCTKDYHDYVVCVNIIEGRTEKFSCTGTLIHKSFVLTAISCVEGNLIVHVGQPNSGVERVVRKVFVEKYRSKMGDVGIALLQLIFPVYENEHSQYMKIPSNITILTEFSRCSENNELLLWSLNDKRKPSNVLCVTNTKPSLHQTDENGESNLTDLTSRETSPSSSRGLNVSGHKEIEQKGLSFFTLPNMGFVEKDAGLPLLCDGIQVGLYFHPKKGNLYKGLSYFVRVGKHIDFITEIMAANERDENVDFWSLLPYILLGVCMIIVLVAIIFCE